MLRLFSEGLGTGVSFILKKQSRLYILNLMALKPEIPNAQRRAQTIHRFDEAAETALECCALANCAAIGVTDRS